MHASLQKNGGLPGKPNVVLGMNPNNESRNNDRREFARLRPNPRAREIQVILASGQQVTGLIEDISRGGLGFVTMPNPEICSDAELTVQYHDLRLQGKVANLAPTPNGFVRAGVEWNHAFGRLPPNAQCSENQCPQIIVVTDAEEGKLFLQQAREDGTDQILISSEQLEQIVAYLSDSDNQKSSEVSMDGPEGSSIQIRVFASDKSFSISQGTKYIWGAGDISGILSHESDTHPIG